MAHFIPILKHQDVQTAHHAGPREHGVVYRVCADTAVGALKLDLDHYEVVNVGQIFANTFFCMSRVAATKHQIASRSNANLVCDVTGEDEVAVGPADLNLRCFRG